jgi:hypothetical protein
LQLNLSAKTGITDLAGNGLANTLNGTGAVYQVDRFTPAPAFTTTPPNPNGTSTSTFVWSEQEAGDHFLCSVENGSFQATVPSAGGSAQPCSAPLTYNVGTTNNGVHQFAVEAVDALGNVSSLISYSWKVGAGSQALTISGNAGKVYPGGATIPFATTVTNPNSSPVTITSLTVTLGAVPSVCQAGWFTLGQSNVSASQPITVPANSSVTLPDAVHAPGVNAPTVLMSDSGDQSNCQNKTIPVSYDGTIPAGFQTGSVNNPFTITFGTATGGPLEPTARNSANKVIETIPVTVANTDPGAEFLHQLVFEITAGWSSTKPGHPPCTASDFSISGEAVNTPHTKTYDYDIPPGAHVAPTPTFTVQMINNDSDQTACAGVHPSFTVVASS